MVLSYPIIHLGFYNQLLSQFFYLELQFFLVIEISRFKKSKMNHDLEAMDQEMHIEKINLMVI